MNVLRYLAIANSIVLGVAVVFVLSAAFAASFLVLVGCGPHRGATCPPRHAVADSGAQTPGNACEVRR